MPDPSSIAQEIKTAFELLATSQRQHGIKTIRRQRTETFGQVGTARVDHGIGAEPPHQRGCAPARGRGEHAGTMPLRELHGEGAHRP